MDNRLKRKFKRAPLRSQCLFTYVDSTDGKEHVLKANTMNLSMGGILLNDLPVSLAAGTDFSLMFKIVEQIEFSAHDPEQLRVLDSAILKNNILRARVRVVRGHDSTDSTNFVSNAIGCEFRNMSDELMAKINNYMGAANKNIVFILNQFEKSGNKKENFALIKNLCLLAGIELTERISDLHRNVLHEYRSLESI